MGKTLFFALWLGAASAMAAQDVTAPPAGLRAALVVEGRGVQVYACKAVSGAGQWVFVAPAARLFNADGVEVGSHGDGPIWQLLDGSSVTGKLISKSPSPDPASIPWLLLRAAGTTGAGKLTGVQFIRRSETKGGVAPGGGCNLGSLQRVPYTATYTFYSSN